MLPEMTKVPEMTKIDEKERIYTFPNSETVTLKTVIEIGIGTSGTHRLRTSDGKLHIIPVGWLHIEIEAVDWSI